MKKVGPPARALEFVNQSNRTGDVCVFQSLLKPTRDTVALAWMTRAAAPTTRVLFTWNEQWEFHWRERDLHVRRRTRITSSQAWPADPGTDNRIVLGYDRKRRAYRFRDLHRGPRTKSLYVMQDGTIPLLCADAGIGMNGRPTHLVRTQPNITLTFHPEVQYWIAFGSFEEGASLDEAMLMGRPAPIHFAPGVKRITATLNRRFEWRVAPARKKRGRSSR